MSLSRALGEKLSRPGTEGGTVEAGAPGARAEVDIEARGPLGARVRRVKVEVDAPAPIPAQAGGICRRARSLGEGLVPVEVEPRLGGAVLRSDPADMRGKEYFEVGLDGAQATVERYRAKEGGGRERKPFTLTHEQLGRLVDDIAEGMGEREEGQERPGA